MSIFSCKSHTLLIKLFAAVLVPYVRAWGTSEGGGGVEMWGLPYPGWITCIT